MSSASQEEIERSVDRKSELAILLAYIASKNKSRSFAAMKTSASTQDEPQKFIAKRSFVAMKTGVRRPIQE